MSGQASIFPAIPPHSSEDELYQSGLDACIEGIENFPVSKRLSPTGRHFTVRSFAKRAVTSPPLSPQRQMWSLPPASSPSVIASMNRLLLHGGPVRGNNGPPRGHQDARHSQDARSNLAVQPTVNAGTFKLKKNAVKIVSVAGPALSAPLPEAPLRPTATLPTPVSSPTHVQVKPQQTETKEHETPQLAQLDVEPPPLSVPTLSPSKIEIPPQTLVANSSLDDMFAQLSAATPTVPSKPAGELCPVGPDKSMFSFEDRLETSTLSTKDFASTCSPTQGQVCPPSSLLYPWRLQDEPTHARSTPEIQQAPSTANWQGETQDEREGEYLHKAAAYFSAFPVRVGDCAHIIKAGATKLHTAYAPNLTKLQPEEVEKLRARYIFAVVNYVNKKVKLNPEPLTADFVKKVLLDSNGDFLQLCAALVKSKYIALDNLKQVTGLCQNVLDVLPKANDSPTAGRSEASKVDAKTDAAPSPTPAINTLKVAAADLLEGMKAWPTQEKREHGTIYRTCVLKGVGEVKSLNQLQALVWGGRLESISMPEPGSDHALVKFLTPEACQAYLDTTENGIEVQGGTKKTIIFVDKQPGPNSINDVIHNCIIGDASRCVRATGADDDWSDGALFKLARGKQQIPRDVDRIKQGKTARNHHYIEFRFGNIYHALSFRRYLMDDKEWEHCSIGYAPDPCELARGVHYKDADEGGGGFFA